MPSKINYGIDNLESWNPIIVDMIAPFSYHGEGEDPIIGGWHCTKISPGCDNCWAEKINFRVGNGQPYGKQKVVFRIKEKILMKPLSWRKPRTIFVCDLCDLFHEDISYDQRLAVINQTDEASRHKYLILTKRPKELLGFRNLVEDWDSSEMNHLWLGVTVCNQAEADEKIIDIAKWLSLEPLLGPIDLHLDRHSNIKWLVVGSESGPKRRPAKQAWIWGIVDQCREAGVSCFVKQLEVNGKLSKDPLEWPASLRVRQLPW